jgi:50S ribosomal subunit-associated GTPase HflX
MLPQAHFCVVGNKRDLVKDEDIAEVKQSFPLEINFLTSARTGEHVEEMFRYIAEQMT